MTVPAPRDASVVELPDTSTVPESCPHDVSGFTPGPYVPAGVKIGSCTTQQISDYDAVCLNQATATSATCKAFQAASPVCSACLETPDEAPSWGPLVVHTAAKTLSVNVAGCMEIEGDKSCAIAFEAVQGCDSAACDFNCPCDLGASLCPMAPCYQAANTGGCKAYSDPLKACENDDGGPITTTCFAGSNFDSSFIAIAPLFCGP